MTTGKFTPLHDAHAIEQLLIAVHFAHPVSGINGSIKEAVKPFKTDLPGESKIQRLVFTTSQGLNGDHQTPVDDAPSFMMSRTAANGALENELRVEPQSITFRTTTYTRWLEKWGQIEKYLAALAPLYLLGKNAIASISLSYIDKFNWVGELEKSSPPLLLKPNSKYITPHVYSQTDLWHSHTGVFLKPDAATKRLLNVNVEHSQNDSISGMLRTVSVATVLTDLFNQPDYAQTNLTSDEIIEFLRVRFANLHEVSKATFKEVISEEMAKRVALY